MDSVGFALRADALDGGKILRPQGLGQVRRRQARAGVDVARRPLDDLVLIGDKLPGQRAHAADERQPRQDRWQPFPRSVSLSLCV